MRAILAAALLIGTLTAFAVFFVIPVYQIKDYPYDIEVQRP